MFGFLLDPYLPPDNPRGLLLAAAVSLGPSSPQRSRAGAQGRGLGWPRPAAAADRPSGKTKEREREREETFVKSRALLAGGLGAERNPKKRVTTKPMSRKESEMNPAPKKRMRQEGTPFLLLTSTSSGGR